MNLDNINEIAEYIVSEGKGILAADESNPTCGKRFDSIELNLRKRIEETIENYCLDQTAW
jgi:fructose-bisphosphate aldolase class 1